MKSDTNLRSTCQRPKSRRAAFTLVEVLIATAATLLLMGLVVQIFATVGDTVSETRSTIQMIDQIRASRQLLKSDLAGVTCPLAPPLDPQKGEGYLEIIEGPIGSRLFPAAAPMLIANGGGLSVYSDAPPGDTTLGDIDDVLMFTTHTNDDPFNGRLMVDYQTAAGSYNTVVTTTDSQDAEVCWFLRGNTLYRRQLLVKPAAKLVTMPGYYANNDVSARQQGGTFSRSADPYAMGGYATANSLTLAANSLKDLTNRQNRYGHQPFAFPYDARFWGPLGLPTLRECSFFNASGFTWPFPLYDPAFANLQGQMIVGPNGPILFPSPPGATAPYSVLPPGGNLPAFPQIPQIYLTVQQGNTSAVGQIDLWSTNKVPAGPWPWDQVDNPPPGGPLTQPSGTLSYFSGYNGLNPSPGPPGNSRLSEDVVLTNVLSFDVRVWDPDASVVAHVGLDGAPGILGIDDDHDGVTDDPKELGAAGSDDIVLAPGDIYVPPVGSTMPTGVLAANAWNYGAVNPLLQLSNWANSQYLGILTLAMAGGSPPAYIIRKGAYVDLCYGQNPAVPSMLSHPDTILSGPGDFRSQLWAGGPLGTNFFVMPAVYDTGSFSYEDDGLDQDFVTANYQSTLLGYTAPNTIPSYGPDQGTNGIDDNAVFGKDDTSGETFTDVNGNGLFDDGASNYTDLNVNTRYDPPETEAPPPYRTRLQGIQIKIRVFDPGSRQVREVTVVQEFDGDN